MQFSNVMNFLSRVPRFPEDFLREINSSFNCCNNITNIQSWLRTLNKLTKAVESDFGSYRQVEDHIFELKVMNYLRKSYPRALIEYEPKGQNQKGKNCDVGVKLNDKEFILELKCIHPSEKEANIPKDHIPKNHNVLMDKISYHQYQATRGHLIDRTLDVEEKFSNYDVNVIKIFGCSIGYYLHEEELRDFVYLYIHGVSRKDDPLGEITQHCLQIKNICFQHSIQQFVAFPFTQCGFNFEEGKRPLIIAPLATDDRNFIL